MTNLCDFAPDCAPAPCPENTPFVRTCPVNAPIFREGELGSEFFIILSGRVSIRKTAEGRSREVAVLGPGEFFGEMAIVDRRPRSATAVALDAGTVVMAVDAARFVYLVTQQPGFAMLVMETLSMRQRGPGATPVEPPPRKRRDLAYEPIRIADDLYQLRSHTRSSNAYLVKGAKKNVLIDTGLPSSSRALANALVEVGLSPSEIDVIVLTHEHFDHTGGVPMFGGVPTVAAYSLAANKIRLNDEFATMQRAFDEPCPPVPVDWELSDGATIDTGGRRLRVFHTPGHSSGSMSLLDQETGALLAGDAVMKGGPIGGIFGSGNISDLIHSLRLLKSLQPALLLPGHGPLSRDPGGDIDLTLDRCFSLLDDSKALFDVLHANEKVRMIVSSYRDLNRQLLS